MSHDDLTCRNILCKNKEHTGIINNLCEKVVQNCVIASDEALPHTLLSGKTLPFWNEIAEPYKKKSLFWHWIWVDCGKPRDGNAARIMRSARSKYHLVVQELKKN